MTGVLGSAAAPAWQHNPSEKKKNKADELCIGLESLDNLELFASKNDLVNRDGAPTLLLDGLTLVRNLEMDDAGLEVEILVENDCYPGLVFHAGDQNNFELAYTVPHISGQSDAMQYDPVFRGSNTWQIYNGPTYQQSAVLPKQKWFRLHIDVIDTRAAIQVEDQAPLIVSPLAHGKRKGRMGFWSYKPAFFRNFRIGPPRPIDPPIGRQKVPQGTVMEWNLEGHGAVFCEPSGILNLTRYIMPSNNPARLVRRFETDRPAEIMLDFGFSDELILSVDKEPAFSGVNQFRGFATPGDRGWIRPDAHQVRRKIDKGEHEVVALLKASEPFGWGLALRLQGTGARWLPATSH